MQPKSMTKNACDRRIDELLTVIPIRTMADHLRKYESL